MNFINRCKLFLIIFTRPKFILLLIIFWFEKIYCLHTANQLYNYIYIFNLKILLHYISLRTVYLRLFDNFWINWSGCYFMYFVSCAVFNNILLRKNYWNMKMKQTWILIIVNLFLFDNVCFYQLNCVLFSLNQYFLIDKLQVCYCYLGYIIVH